MISIISKNRYIKNQIAAIYIAEFLSQFINLTIYLSSNLSIVVQTIT